MAFFVEWAIHSDAGGFAPPVLNVKKSVVTLPLLRHKTNKQKTVRASFIYQLCSSEQQKT